MPNHRQHHFSCKLSLKQMAPVVCSVIQVAVLISDMHRLWVMPGTLADASLQFLQSAKYAQLPELDVK